MKELVLENGIIYYDDDIGGGGSTFGINALKDDNVKLSIKSALLHGLLHYNLKNTPT